MKRIALLVAVCALVLVTTTWAEDKPAASISVKVDNLSCSSALGSGTFPILAWSFGATQTGDLSGGGGGGAGKAVGSDLNVQKRFDECSPALFGGVTTGKHFPTATLVQQDQKKNSVMIVTLTDLLIRSYQLSGSQADANPVERVSFNFSKICISDVQSGKQACFDFKAQKAD